MIYNKITEQKNTVSSIKNYTLRDDQSEIVSGTSIKIFLNSRLIKRNVIESDRDAAQIALSFKSQIVLEFGLHEINFDCQLLPFYLHRQW